MEALNVLNLKLIDKSPLSNKDNMIKKIEETDKFKLNGKGLSNQSFTHRYFHSFVNKREVLESKRWSKHLSRRRADINMFINYKYGVFDVEDNVVKDVAGDPLVQFMANNVLCSMSMNYEAETYTQEEWDKFVATIKECICVHSYAPSYSLAQKFLRGFINDYVTEHGSFPKKYMPAIEGNGYEIEAGIQPTMVLWNNISEGNPALLRFWQYVNEPNTVIWEDIPTFSELVEEIYEEVMTDYIKKKAAENKDVNEDNYTTFTKLETDKDYTMFLLEMYNAVERDAFSIFVEIALPVVDERIRQSLAETQKETDSAYKENAEANYKIAMECKQKYDESKEWADKLAKENEQLHKELEKEKKSKKEVTRGFLEKISGLTKKEKKDEEKIKELSDKCEELLEYIKIKEDTVSDDSLDEDNEEDVQVDTEKRYIFVSEKGREGYRMNKVIEETFPNSVVKYGSFTVQKDTCDMVVLLTCYTAHGTYWGVRDQCKDKGIPVVHCSRKSITSIKRAIAGLTNYVNRG